MNILFIGDIVGRSGRQAVKHVLPNLRKEKNIDFVIANGENLAGGTGMTHDTYREMLEAGVDYFTSGNHIWKKGDFASELDSKNIKVLRPANYPESVSGRGFVDLKIENLPRRQAGCILKIINLQGLVFMPEYLDNPFLTADKLIDQDNKLITIVDLHAEATSEKNCLGYYLDGRVSAVIGTHTHVQTNDARILPKGTAYLTDAGMCGSLNSSIGDNVEYAINHFLNGLPFRLDVAKEKPLVFNAVLINIDEKTTKANSIELINKIIE